MGMTEEQESSRDSYPVSDYSKLFSVDNYQLFLPQQEPEPSEPLLAKAYIFREEDASVYSRKAYGLPSCQGFVQKLRFDYISLSQKILKKDVDVSDAGLYIRTHGMHPLPLTNRQDGEGERDVTQHSC